MLRRSSNSPRAVSVTSTAELPFSATPTVAFRGARRVAIVSFSFAGSAVARKTPSRWISRTEPQQTRARCVVTRPAARLVTRYRQPREKWSVDGEPPRYELGEEPDALRLPGLPVRQEPERCLCFQLDARHPHQQAIGIANETRQSGHTDPLPRRSDLRLGVRCPERNSCRTNLALVRPTRSSLTVDDDGPDGIPRPGAPRGQPIERHINAREQLRPLNAMKIERQGLTIGDNTDRDVRLSVGQIHHLAGRYDLHLENLLARCRQAVARR